jgi:small subunit ribosomal protein S6
MRLYEVIFIVRPDLPEEDRDKLLTQMEGVVTGGGGTVQAVEKMGLRRLAYRVGKYREGFYVLLTLEGSGDTVKEFARRLKVTDAVIKYLTVRIDEERKRVEKLKALRAKAESRRAQPRAKPPAPLAPQSAVEAVEP